MGRGYRRAANRRKPTIEQPPAVALRYGAASATKTQSQSLTTSLRQGFRRNLFNGVCGSCHGSVSGLENDIAANPDILTRASEVLARDQTPQDRTTRGAIAGPDFP